MRQNLFARREKKTKEIYEEYSMDAIKVKHIEIRENIDRFYILFMCKEALLPRCLVLGIRVTKTIPFIHICLQTKCNDYIQRRWNEFSVFIISKHVKTESSTLWWCSVFIPSIIHLAFLCNVNDDDDATFFLLKVGLLFRLISS